MHPDEHKMINAMIFWVGLTMTTYLICNDYDLGLFCVIVVPLLFFSTIFNVSLYLICNK